MKVLVVTNMYPHAEAPHAGSFIKSQMDSLAQKGVELTIINSNRKRGFTKYFRAWAELFRRSFDPEFDLIHAHYGYSGLISLLQWKLPVLVSFCGGDVLGNPDDRGRVKPEYLLFTCISWAVSVISPAVIVKSAEMKRRLPVKNELYVIPNGVDFTLFRPLDKDTARRELQLAPDKKYVLFPANPDWPRKCFSVAAEAVDILAGSGMDVELIVVHSQEQHIVPLYMNACDAMVLTSYWEGSPNVIKESMACNLPIVSVDAGDVSEVISGCRNCSIVPRNAAAVAAGLAPILISGRRSDGRDHIGHLELGQVAATILNIYTKMIHYRHRRHV